MHSKQKGNVGFTATVLELQKNLFNVFSEIGDYSKIDLIAERNKKLITIQVKYAKVTNGIFTLPLRKCGPNGYKYTYSSSDIDWFAIYCPWNDQVYWISSEEACDFKSQLFFRLTPTKSGQKIGCRFADDYKIDRLLRAVYVEHPIKKDDDGLQTATEMVSES